MKNTISKDLKILIVDDEEMWLHSISLTLRKVGGFTDIRTCSQSRKVMEILARMPINLVLLDLVMPGCSGEELLSMIVQAHPQIPVIIITGLDQVDVGVRCMKMGAFDFFAKTVGRDELVSSVQRAVRLIEMQTINEKLSTHLLSDRLDHPELFSDIITQDSKMQSIFRYIEAVSDSSQPLLITGASGTGKELIARAAHKASRPDRPFITLNVAGLDDNVFSDTLFGHVKGAYTGAEQSRSGMIGKAAGGVVFLDEVGDLNMGSQVKLLRLLQEGEYFPLGSDESRRTKARFFFATNTDLEQAMASGKFRKDLYYRMKTHHIHLPPLSERQGDMALLLNHFIHAAAGSMGKKPPRAGKDIVLLFESHEFKGNIREFMGIIHDAVARCESGRLDRETVRRLLGDSPPGKTVTGESGTHHEPDAVTFPRRLPTLREVNRLLILEAMKRANGNQTIAAGFLGISQSSLSRRLKLLKAKG